MKTQYPRRLALAFIATLLFAMSPLGLAQNSDNSTTASVPHLIKFSGVAKDDASHPQTGIVGITFALYRDQQGGAPLWLETQNVQADANGHYTVMLGAANGLPMDFFSSNDARWVGAQPQGQSEQPRVLLVSAPYALKAGDAATIGGLPPSAFVRANPESGAPGSPGESAGASSSGQAQAVGKAPGIVPQNQAQPETLLAVKTFSPGDTVGFLPVWSGSKSPTNQIGSSNLFQSGGNVGLGTTSPAASLDVNGTGTFRDTLTLFPKGSDLLFAVKTSQGTPISITNGGNELDGTFGNFQGLDGSAPVFTVNNASATGLSANSEGTGGIGIEGSAGASSGKTTGILGIVNSPNGTGVLALGQGESQTGSGILGCCAVGLWGDTSSHAQGAAGLVGTADDARAIYLQNNSPSGVPTAFMFQGASGKFALVAGGATGACTVDTNGNLGCHGSKSAVVEVDNGQRQVALYAVEAPQNWFEDFGSGQLSSGSATVVLEPTFAQTVNTGSEYHVFLTPEGDCRGLYVSNKSAAGFEVHELGGGQSQVAFDYRIVALRRGYENVRLEDKTAMMAKARMAEPSVTPGARWTLPSQPIPRHIFLRRLEQK